MSCDIAISVRSLEKTFHLFKKPLVRLWYSIFSQSNLKHVTIPAIKNISFEVKKGTIFGIIGKNGSGKSTLLQIISKTLYPTSGSVDINGKVAALLELGAGFDPDFTGRENVYMNARIYGLSQKQIDRRFDDIVKFSDIGDFIDKPVKIYSSGMYVRLAFSVIVHVDADILIIDEALAVGDESFQRKCYSFLEQYRNAGNTILFVSHSPSAVLSLCDEVLLLHDGDALAIGKPKIMLGYYQQLVYSDAISRESIIKSILSNKNLELEDNYTSHEKQYEGYDDGFQSKSKIEYVSNGAIISDVILLNSNDNKVNMLLHGETYTCKYKVRIERDVTFVRFGLLIKSLSGIELGGCVTSLDTRGGIEHLNSGDEVEAVFTFRCLLNPGSYFLNAGITGISNGVDTFLHRILDAYAFKVLPTESISSAYVNFDFRHQYRIL